ncbi:TetR/AcrR family transcriptional regulator [Streptomyces buecherae]|uniref:TetR/AcrR family transcriptional regulator n=1 Tax=Streptomyces buecherae TaxID=2763006 RepID=UPI001C257469|nr:TetR/AcrR family transcriptional regulator [Streptomyces buecherae]
MVEATRREPSRRERLRAEATEQIMEIALRQMAVDGPGALSLRGIAREMGMTPRAIYSYFPTRDDLVTELIRTFGHGLADALERARDEAPASDPERRLLAWGEALRAWALAHPQGFQLVYGDPLPGYQPPPGEGPVDEAALRICGGLNRLVAACASRPAPTEPDDDWSDFPPAYRARVRAEAPDLTPAVAARALRIWARLHGLVTLEIHGHLRPVYGDPAALYRAEMLDLLRDLGRAAPDA